MRFFAYFLSALLIFTAVNSNEFRIDFSDEGMNLLKKRGFGKKTIYTNQKDEYSIKYLNALKDKFMGVILNKVDLENLE